MLRVARLFLVLSLALVVFLLTSTASLSAQEGEAGAPADAETIAESTSEAPPDPDENNPVESSPYLLDLNLGDSDVDLRWEGYWRMTFQAGGSFGKVGSGTSFRGLSSGTSFYQEPDVTLTLWIFDKWFLETTFLEGFDRNTYRAGYIGAPGEFVREVVVGNAGVSASGYAEIDVPNPSYNTPGIVGKFATDISDHQILVRYDPTDTEEIFFQGQYEVNTQDIGLPEFIQGRYFILPDTGVSDVVVYLEQESGNLSGTDGLGVSRNYRQAEDAEFFYDSDSGLLVLSKAHTGQVVVYYTAAGGNVGDATVTDFIITPDANLRPIVPPTGYSDFDFATATDVYDTASPQRTFAVTSRVTGLPAGDALILYQPGRFSPFERQNVYLSSRPLPEETWRIVPLLQDRGSLYPSTTTEFGFIPDTVEKTISVYGASGSPDGLRDPENRYPFAGSDPEVYGPGRETDPDKLSRQIVLAIRELNSGYNLGTGVVPGSVVVRVNGVQDKTVEVGDDGSLSFSRYIYLDDWIEVEYRTETLDLDGGDLYVYQGNRFSLAPNLNLELAESFRWNLAQDRTSTEYEQSPGEIVIASTLDWEVENAAIRLTADAALTTPDTAGNFRLFGMDEGRMDMVFLEETIVGAPDAAAIPGNLTAIRDTADQYNYIYTNAFGSETLNDYMWPGASPTGEDAPALAARRTGDAANGRVMEIRFDLETASTEWTAGDFLADYSGPIDISNFTSIDFPVMFLDDYGTPGTGLTAPTIRLQAGEIGESDDHHDDGIVNKPNSGLMTDWTLDTDNVSTAIADAWASPGSWEWVSIPLSTTDAARLSSVRSFRIILENDTGGDISGRYIMGAPEFTGSSFRTEVRTVANELAADQDIAADEVSNDDIDDLLIEYPETRTLFHYNDEENESLRIRWGADLPGGTALATGDRWEAVSWFDGIPLESYRTLVFYAYNPTAGTNPMTASATDAEGNGVRISWTADTAGWDRFTIDIAEGTAESDKGQAITGISVDNNAGEITRFVLSMTDVPGAQSGTVYLDEVHFRDPAYSVTAGTELQASWQYPDDVAAIGNFPVLGDISVNGRAQVAAGAVLSGLERENTAVAGLVSFQADVLGVGLTTDWQTSWNGGDPDWSGSHNLKIPARSPIFWIEDTYSHGITGDDTSFSRSNDLYLNLGAGSLHLDGDTLYGGDSLTQSWGGDTAWKGKFWNFGLDVNYILNTDEEPDTEEGYFSSWIHDYAYLLPSDADVNSREAHHTAAAGLAFGRFAVNWDPELRIKTGSAPIWYQDNIWGGTLSFPVTFGRWNLTTSYRRYLSQAIAPDRHNSFGDSWAEFSDGIGGQFPLVYYMPFRELFGTRDGEKFETATAGMSTVDYESEFLVNFRRGTGSRIYDLILPTNVELSMERRYKRKGDTVGWENEWRGSATLAAINLFGSFGRYPILPFYNSDEFSTLLQLTLEDYNGTTVPEPGDLTIQTNWGFNGIRERRFVVDYRISFDWDIDVRQTDQEGRLEYQWRTPSRDQLRLPLLKRVIPRQHHIENKERFSIRGAHPWSDAPSGNYLDYGFIVYHETSWVFQDAGHLKGWLAIGLGETDDEFNNGWELGLEAEFRF